MSVDPQVIRSESHTEIGEILQHHVNDVLDRWSKRAAEEQPHAKRVHHDVLLNKLFDFLKTLGKSLVESEPAHNGRHCIFASNHGEQRWEAGWSLAELIRDFQILRLVILDFLDEMLDRPVRYREVLAIGLALDEAIAASVVMYVKGRDEHLRQLEEKRANEDKQMQERLREQAEALREADRRKNEYLAVLAHELRNPLAPVRNAMHIFKLKVPSDSELQWPREVIERQVQQMSRMIDDLLDVSRITLGKLKLEREPADMATVVTRAVEIARPLMDAKKHRLAVTLPQEPAWLECDVSRLTQVLVNLLTNAAKYTDEAGEVFVTVECNGPEIILKVRDTGIGIPADLLPRVFDPFTQDERSQDRAQGGLGIGLTLARTLVDLHGGRIQVLSAGRGKGSEFVVYLPKLQGAPTERPEAQPPKKEAAANARRILVVDDLPDAAKSLAMLLQLLGNEVRTAGNGTEALETARHFLPEVVLLDIGLPGMDGLEVARRLRQEPSLSNTLLVALTGYGHEDDRRRSQESGFNAHLVKPVDLDELQILLASSRSLPDS
jgi:signal transduction histidine kinase/ActR/RegA family two-component response regulator